MHFKLEVIWGAFSSCECILCVFVWSLGLGHFFLSWDLTKVCSIPSLCSVVWLFAPIVSSILVSMDSQVFFIGFVSCSFSHSTFCNSFCGEGPLIFVSQSEVDFLAVFETMWSLTFNIDSYAELLTSKTPIKQPLEDFRCGLYHHLKELSFPVSSFYFWAFVRCPFLHQNHGIAAKISFTLTFAIWLPNMLAAIRHLHFVTSL